MITVTVPPDTGPEIVVTDAASKRTYTVDNNLVQVETQAQADELVVLIEGAQYGDASAPDPTPVPDQAPPAPAPDQAPPAPPQGA